jgi:hypothetical protein
LSLFIRAIYQSLFSYGWKLLPVIIVVPLLISGCGSRNTDITKTSSDTSAITDTITTDSESNPPAGSLSTSEHYYNLSVFIIPAGSGTVELDPQGVALVPGIKVTLLATALEGYKFDHWSGDTSGTSSSVIITMDSNKKINAYFESMVPVTTVTAISPQAAKLILDTDPAVLFVDVRPEADYQKEHIPGAISIPFEEFEIRYSEITASPQVIIYSKCH